MKLVISGWLLKLINAAKDLFEIRIKLLICRLFLGIYKAFLTFGILLLPTILLRKNIKTL